METILHQFPVEGKPIRIEEIVSGHINRSYDVETDAGRRYVLQRVNRYVFRDVDAIMENLSLLREHLRGMDGAPPIVCFIDTKDGKAYYEDGEGGAWRLCPYILNSVSLLRPGSPEDFYQSALAFGRFQYTLRDFPVERLSDTIPRFHDTPNRYRQLRDALAADPKGSMKNTLRDITANINNRL